MVNTSVVLKRDAGWRRIGNPGANLVQHVAGFALVKIAPVAPTSDDGAITVGSADQSLAGNYDQPLWGKSAPWSTSGARLSVTTPQVGARAVLTATSVAMPSADARQGSRILQLPDYTADEAPRTIAGTQTWATILPDGSIGRGSGALPRGASTTLDVVQPSRDGIEAATTTTMTFTNANVTQLGALSLVPSLPARALDGPFVGRTFEARVAGKSAGSTLILTGPGADGLGIADGNLIFGRSTALGAINVVETLEGATGSPRASNNVATVTPAPVVAAPTIWRATSGGPLRIATPGYAGGQYPAARRSGKARVPIKVPFRTGKMRLHRQLFPFLAPAQATTKYDQAFAFQDGIEPTFLAALTGIPARTLVTYGGARFFAYDPATDDPARYTITSDVIDIAAILGRFLEQGDVFGLHSAVELPAGVSGQRLPTSQPLANWHAQRFIGRADLDYNIINGYNGAANDEALTGGSYTAAPSNQGGALPILMPFRVSFEAPATTVGWLGIGDSLMQNQKEAYDSDAPASGDILGDVDANPGYFMRAAARHKVAAVNYGRGSDQGGYWVNRGLRVGLYEDIADIAPSEVWYCLGQNDIQGATLSAAWANGQAYSVDTMVRTATQWYMCVQSGTATVEPTHTDIGNDAQPGGGTNPVWRNIGPRFGDNRDNAYSQFYHIQRVLRIVSERNPNVKRSYMLPFCRTTSTDGWTTIANQTVVTTYRLDNARGGIIERMSDPAFRAALGITRIADVREAYEDLATGKFLPNVSDDGVHLVSRAHKGMADRWPAPLAA